MAFGCEVRTLAPTSDPRLWGRGRPGTKVCGSAALLGLRLDGSQTFRLPAIAVTWEAADACAELPYRYPGQRRVARPFIVDDAPGVLGRPSFHTV